MAICKYAPTEDNIFMTIFWNVKTFPPHPLGMPIAQNYVYNQHKYESTIITHKRGMDSTGPSFMLIHSHIIVSSEFPSIPQPQLEAHVGACRHTNRAQPQNKVTFTRAAFHAYITENLEKTSKGYRGNTTFTEHNLLRRSV